MSRAYPHLLGWPSSSYRGSRAALCGKAREPANWRVAPPLGGSVERRLDFHRHGMYEETAGPGSLSETAPFTLFKRFPAFTDFLSILSTFSYILSGLRYPQFFSTPKEKIRGANAKYL